MTGCGVIVTGCGVRDRAAAYATEQLAAPAELSCCADAGEAGYRQQERLQWRLMPRALLFALEQNASRAYTRDG